MPSLKRSSNRQIQDTDSSGNEDSNREEGSESEGEQGRLNDSLLSKVDPQYLNQSLDIKQGDLKLKSPIAQLSKMEKEFKETSNLLHNVASEFAESLREDFRQVEFDQDKYIKFLIENDTMKVLEKEYRRMLEKSKEMHIRSKTLANIRNKVVQAHPVTNLWELYQTSSDSELKQYQSLSTREKFLKDKDYIGFITLVWEEFTGGAPMPNIKKFLPKDTDDNGGEARAGGGGEGEEEDSDDELEIGAQSTDFRCPLTASILEDPFTSTECPHSYSGDAIKEYITKTGKGSIACPVAGCSKILTLAKVVRDDNLRKRVEKHLKRIEKGQNHLAGTQGNGANGGEEGGLSGTAATGGRTYMAIEDSDED
ncbi:hypothetical protein JCM3765_004039 [Sporobolomyces pararoseus]